MNAEIILTTNQKGRIEEKVIGTTKVTIRTNVREVLSRLAKQHFDSIRHVRRDSTVFGWTAVDSYGNTIHLK